LVQRSEAQVFALAKQFSHLEPHHHRFIAEQHMFFTASAAPTGHVNVSPRSTDMFRVLGNNAVMYLDRTAAETKRRPISGSILV
jgi:predicted pyridoxine 5'-phosphate oxidase superfamily flavin-nucleotide-binding protein